MLQENKPLAPFSLPAASPGGTAAEGSLSNADFAGRPFVLYIYPKDNTPGCNLEAQGFRDAHEGFEKLGVRVVGLSRDTVGAHRRFIVSQGLHCTLLADKEQEWLHANDLIVNGMMYGKPVTRVARTTVFVDAKGVVRHIWRDVKPPGHATEVLEKTAELVRTRATK